MCPFRWVLRGPEAFELWVRLVGGAELVLSGRTRGSWGFQGVQLWSPATPWLSSLRSRSLFRENLTDAHVLLLTKAMPALLGGQRTQALL